MTRAREVRSHITRVTFAAEDEARCAQCGLRIVGECLRYEMPGRTEDDEPEVALLHFECEP